MESGAEVENEDIVAVYVNVLGYKGIINSENADEIKKNIDLFHTLNKMGYSETKGSSLRENRN